MLMLMLMLMLMVQFASMITCTCCVKETRVHLSERKGWYFHRQTKLLHFEFCLKAQTSNHKPVTELDPSHIPFYVDAILQPTSDADDIVISHRR